jgi:hypothetical protein
MHSEKCNRRFGGKYIYFQGGRINKAGKRRQTFSFSSYYSTTNIFLNSGQTIPDLTASHPETLTPSEML